MVMSKKTKVIGGLFVFLAFLLVIVVAGAWFLRDRIAIAMMHREIERRPAPERLPPPSLDPELRDELAAYLAAHPLSPEAYILSKFDDHDIVFLGEHHRIKEDVELVHRLIPLLHERGVYNLGLEFADHEDQELIDALITADVYDAETAKRILFNNFVMWGYQEYADIFRVAWEVNRGLQAGAKPFRVVGLDVRTDWSHVRSADDLNDAAVLARVWFKGDGDEVMGRTVLREFVDRGQKALVYCGLHHAFTRYKQPRAIDADGNVGAFFDRRMGNIVYAAIGDRAVTIALHASWPGATARTPQVYAADGAVDALMSGVDSRLRRVGFDTRGTPFGELTGEASSYHYGHEDFTLGDLCDGYVYHTSLREFTGVTPIAGFIDRHNVRRAKQQSPNSRFRTGGWRWLGPAFINELIARDADMDRTLAAFRYWGQSAFSR